MLRTFEDDEFEREIQAAMREHGLDYGEAQVLVALRLGELHNDLLFVHPLTNEQRHRRRRSLKEILAEGGSARQPIETLPSVTTLKADERARRSAD